MKHFHVGDGWFYLHYKLVLFLAKCASRTSYHQHECFSFSTKLFRHLQNFSVASITNVWVNHTAHKWLTETGKLTSHIKLLKSKKKEKEKEKTNSDFSSKNTRPWFMLQCLWHKTDLEAQIFLVFVFHQHSQQIKTTLQPIKELISSIHLSILFLTFFCHSVKQISRF